MSQAKNNSEHHRSRRAQAQDLVPRSSSEAIIAGVNYLFSARRDFHWQDFTNASAGAEVWVTAYVLARLAELPPNHINPSNKRKIEDSLKWLSKTRSASGAWGFNLNSPDDIESTAWAVLALKRNHHEAPREALEFIQACRRSDGGIAPYPESSPHNKAGIRSTPDLTAIGALALGTMDAAAAGFLSSCWLQTNDPRGNWRLLSPLFTCDTILDCGNEVLSHMLLDKVCELLAHHHSDNAFEQALLLRCMVHLRLQKKWSVAAGLRRMQRPSGDWTPSAALHCVEDQSLCLDDKGIVTTATCIAALARGDERPGLYFGSDRPAPRRFSF